jgi:hypothetical protein
MRAHDSGIRVRIRTEQQMPYLVRHDMSQQHPQVYMKALVQFLGRLEKYIAVTPASIFAQIGDAKNRVCQILGPSRDRQLQVLGKLRNTAGRSVPDFNSRQLAIYPVHVYPCLLEDRTRRALRLSKIIRPNPRVVVDSDGHENLRRPLVFCPYRKSPQTKDKSKQNIPSPGLVLHGFTSSVKPNLRWARRYLNACGMTPVPSLDDELSSFTSNRCAPK